MTEKEATAAKGEDFKKREFSSGQSEAGNCVSADSSNPETVEGQTREQRRAKRKEVAAWGERKVKEAGKVGNSGSFPCDSSRSE